MSIFSRIVDFFYNDERPSEKEEEQKPVKPEDIRHILNHLGISFSKMQESIWDVVKNAHVAAWAKVEGDISLTEYTVKKLKEAEEILKAGLTLPEYIALIRGKMESIFGVPSHRGDEYKNSFVYEILAEIEGNKIYFAINDRKGEEVSLSWEYTTSTRAERRVVEYAFWEMLKDVKPADYEDSFNFDGMAGVKYGCKDGMPYVDISTANPANAEENAAE